MPNIKRKPKPHHAIIVHLAFSMRHPNAKHPFSTIAKTIAFKWKWCIYCSIKYTATSPLQLFHKHVLLFIDKGQTGMEYTKKIVISIVSGVTRSHLFENEKKTFEELRLENRASK